MAKIIPFPVPGDWLQQSVVSLGVISAAFGVVSFVAPRWFARTSGLPAPDDPAADVAIRSVGVRDTIIGLGIWSAATHGGNVAPWILARGISDAGDTAGVLLAWLQGARNPRLLGLGAIALAATVADFTLWTLARRQRFAARRPAERPAQINA
ncbi:MAG: DUF4267 domain-containing protein [Chloroflexi bacterium]|nr:DUF4267 domain-containing protein [Chloroflexota bacterium]